MAMQERGRANSGPRWVDAPGHDRAREESVLLREGRRHHGARPRGRRAVSRSRSVPLPGNEVESTGCVSLATRSEFQCRARCMPPEGKHLPEVRSAISPRRRTRQRGRLYTRLTVLSFRSGSTRALLCVVRLVRTVPPEKRRGRKSTRLVWRGPRIEGARSSPAARGFHRRLQGRTEQRGTSCPQNLHRDPGRGEGRSRRPCPWRSRRPARRRSP